MNNLLRYTDRDFNSIKEDLLAMIESVNTEWTSREESDPGIVLLNLMAALGDNLSFNMDMMSSEMYLSTVTQRNNCKKLLELGGYKMHWYRSATANVNIINNSLNSTLTLITDFTLPDNNITITSSDSNTTYTLFVPTNLESNKNLIQMVNINSQSSYSFIAVEGKLNNCSISTNQIINNRFYLPINNVDEKYLFLYDPSKSTFWKLVDDLALVNEENNYFEFNVDEEDNPYIQLVSYWEKYFNDSIGSYDLQLYYLESSGAAGSVNDNAFSYIISAPFVSGSETGLNYTIRNKSNRIGTLSSGNTPGYNPQDVEDAKADYANYINTYNTLVTIFDFEKFTMRQSGISIARAIDGQKAAELNAVVFNSFDDGDDEDIDEDATYIVPTLQRDIANLGRYRKYVLGGEYTYDSTAIANQKDTLGYTYTKSKNIKSYTLNIYAIYMEYDVNYNDIEDPNLWNYPMKLPYDENVGFTEISELEGMGESDIQLDTGVVTSLSNNSSSSTEPTTGSFFDKFKDAQGNSTVTFTRRAPFRRYKLSNAKANDLLNLMQDTKIITVDVNFPECRVFDWRIKGTIFLYEPVTKDEASSIINIIINTMANKFTSEYVGFGNKIRYMDVIETVTNCDSRIKYFDAGYGTEPLIDYADCFDVINYFNDISIMRYNQYSVPASSDVAPRYNTDESGKELIIIDPSCIKEDDY